jgi:hypothetical protein
MGRPLLYPDHMLAQFPAQTFDRIGKVLESGEDRASFVRRAIESELARRERTREKHAVRKQPPAKVRKPGRRTHV